MPDGGLLFLHALTGLHPGSGAALDAIDLPVQRERHTSWPLIPGSSLKGVLRAATKVGDERDEDHKNCWLTVFGPETVTDTESHAGAITVTDARILAFPVRSLQGVFAWATCPAVLTRLAQDVKLAPGTLSLPAEMPQVVDGEILCAPDTLVINDETVVLEEYDFHRRGNYEAWATALAARITGDAALQDRFKARLAILSDNDFGHFVRYATEVTARIGLEAWTKTVKNGALFYQEVLPPETLFYSVIRSEHRTGTPKEMEAAAAMDWLRETVPDVIQIGADETIGRGFCATRMHRPAQGGA